MSVAGPLGITHFLLLTQTEETLNLRIAKFPQGPTLYFRLHGYTLHRDIQTSASRPRSFLHEFDTAPLLVLNNFNNTTSNEGKLMCTMLQSMFPTVNTAKVRLTDIRRVVLCHYSREDDMMEFRHYSISVKMVGVSKSVKRLMRSEIPNLSNYDDISEYIMKEAAGSDSEFEEDSVVTLGQDYLGKLNRKSSRRAVHLTEIGPRFKMQLVKILDGFCAGKTIYHVEGKRIVEEQKKKNVEKKAAAAASGSTGSSGNVITINPKKTNNFIAKRDQKKKNKKNNNNNMKRSNVLVKKEQKRRPIKK